MNRITFFLLNLILFGFSSPVRCVDSLTFKAYNPNATIDSLGNITCIWENVDGANTTIDELTIPVNSEHPSSKRISVLGEDVCHPQLATSVFRETIAVWEKFDGKHHVIQTSKKPLGKDWTIPVTLSNASENAIEPKIVAGKGGEIVAVWKRFDGDHLIIQSSQKLFDSEWGGVRDISSKRCHAAHPQFAINPTGLGIAIWELTCEDGSHLIQSSTLSPDGNWEEPQNLSLSLEKYSSANNPQIGISDSGEAIAVWQIDLANGCSVIQSSIKPVNGNWLPPFDLSPSDRKSVSPKIAVSPQGEAIIIWKHHEGDNRMMIQSRTRGTDGQWSALNEIFQANCLEMDSQLAITPSGDAVVMWTVEDTVGSSVIYYSTKKSNESWKPPSKLIESSFKASALQIVIDSGPHIYAFWQIKDTNGEYFVQFSDQICFSLPALPLPAQQFEGKLIKRGRNIHKQYSHFLTWKPSPDPDIKWYKLYRNGKRIAKISHDAPPNYIVKRVPKTEKVVYDLVAINSKGERSDPQKISFPK